MEGDVAASDTQRVRPLSRSSVVLLNAVPELPPPELATVSLPLLSSRSVRPLLAVFSRYFSQQSPLCVVMKLEPMASPSPPRPTGGQMERTNTLPPLVQSFVVMMLMMETNARKSSCSEVGTRLLDR